MTKPGDSQSAEKGTAKPKAPKSDAQAPAQTSSTEQQGILHIGIDLGTSRSAIAASNGARECIGSVVGWPRDAVSTKLYGQDVLFGDEALEKRLALDIVFPLADGNLRFPDCKGDEKDRHREAADELMKRLVQLSRPRPDQLVYGVVGAPAEATTKNKQAIIEIARKAGMDSVMVVSEPFSVAYGIEALDECLVIDIGAGTIDLCRLHGTLPEVDDQVTIFKAGNFVDEELARLIKEQHQDAQFTINMVKKAKERFSGVIESSERAIVTFPVNGTPTDIDVTEQMQLAVRVLIPEILQGIQTLVSSFDPEFQHRLRERVYVSGGGSQIYGLQRALEEGMQTIGGGKVYLVDEPVFAGANGSLKMAREMPADYWEELKSY